eukprot:scaffold209791_cov42-Prasinocladus_malaysianus.AAC.5
MLRSTNPLEAPGSSHYVCWRATGFSCGRQRGSHLRPAGLGPPRQPGGSGGAGRVRPGAPRARLSEVQAARAHDPPPAVRATLPDDHSRKGKN